MITPVTLLTLLMAPVAAFWAGAYVLHWLNLYPAQGNFQVTHRKSDDS
jgi:hypothetical protein